MAEQLVPERLLLGDNGVRSVFWRDAPRLPLRSAPVPRTSFGEFRGDGRGVEPSWAARTAVAMKRPRRLCGAGGRLAVRIVHRVVSDPSSRRREPLVLLLRNSPSAPAPPHSAAQVPASMNRRRPRQRRLRSRLRFILYSCRRESHPRGALERDDFRATRIRGRVSWTRLEVQPGASALPCLRKIRPSSCLSTSRRNRFRARRGGNLSGRPRALCSGSEQAGILRVISTSKSTVYRVRSLVQTSENEDLFLAGSGREAQGSSLFLPVTREKQGGLP